MEFGTDSTGQRTSRASTREVIGGTSQVKERLKAERWYEPHREHFYQRLIRSGRSHPFVTGLEMALQGVVLGLMVLYLHASLSMRAGLIALVVLIWLAFFAFCEHAFRRKTEMLKC